MKREKISEAMGNISSRHIKEAAEFKAEEKPHRSKTPWVKWASLAACFCFAIMAAVIGGQSSNISSVAIINYGPFIFIPVLIVSFIPLCISFVRKETTLKSSLITSAISLVVVNILNVLGVYLYLQLGGINIFGSLSIILISSNIGAIVSIATITLLDKKTKTWWAKLLLWTLISIVSIVFACIVHNIILTLFQGDMITIA